jgi:hypothetical protein
LGCKYEDPFAESLDIDSPVTTVSSLVYVDHSRDQLIFVDPKDDELDVNYIPFGDETDRAAWCVATRDESEVLVLKIPADAKQEDVEEQLFRYPADGDDDPVVYDVLAPFTSVALSPDHQTAVLYFGTDSGEHLQNANQVGIVDLQGKGVRNLTLNGFGGRLNSVHFPGQIREGEPILVEIGTHFRDIATFLADGEIVLVDMADEVADQVAVRFDENVSFSPQATLLRPGDPELFPDPTLFIRSSFGSDVAMLTLKDKQDEMTGADGFTALVSLIPVGGTANDFVYHDEGGVPLLITVAGARLVFTDIRTQESFDVQLDGSATNVLLRDHETPSGTIRQAVAWQQGGRHLHTLELDGIQSTLGRKPSRLKIETGIEELVVLDNDRVLIGSGTILYVVDFTKDQVTPLTSQVAYDPSSSALDGETLYLGTPGQDWMSTADLTTLNPESMILDDTIQSFHYLRDSKKVVLAHADDTGHLTVTDAKDPGRSNSQVYWGFLIDGVLDTAKTEGE